ncbi:hypothetical protein HOT32_gp28 [Erwinia phage Faunus]|uniref:Uncharacterized protein n=1 Tax=Erwinia phage Faunus TaxID=2182346 RepID=A0A2U8UWI4_9CAUD|nr:hypothetical protein HOT32_gp28 [Erwinia phage Faunus]AWN08611.1 hypothetical protein [Erwinia phage Faunus]
MAKVVTVTQYEAQDGSLFLTEHECDAHDFKLENGAKIDVIADAFLNTTGAIDRSRNMQKNVIEAFLAFHLPRVAAGTELEPVERTKFDTPKAEKEVTTAAAETAEADIPGAEDAEQPAF